MRALRWKGEHARLTQVVPRISVLVRRVVVDAVLLRRQPERDWRAQHVAKAADAVAAIGQQEGLDRVVELRLLELDQFRPQVAHLGLAQRPECAFLPGEQVAAVASVRQSE
eukprot:scaffold51333_cov27-Tisochrysis_lutea.AAC.4